MPADEADHVDSQTGYRVDERRQIRGSALLTAGRVISLSLNFLVQVLAVRYLAKHDYGALAFAISVVELASMSIALGTDKAVARFAPMYHQRGEYSKLCGCIVVAAAIMSVLGLVGIGAVWGGSSSLAEWLEIDTVSAALVTMLIVLAPLGALESLVVGLLATFGLAKVVLLTRHLLAPSARLAALLTTVALAGGVQTLAGLYLIAGCVSTLVVVLLLAGEVRRQGLFQHFRPAAITLPWRDILGFSLPLLTSDLAFLLRGSLLVILLGYFQSASHVAELAAVMPLARLVEFVLVAFSIMFLPAAARLFAKDDLRGLAEVYSRTFAWIAILSWPLFAVTFALARPLTEILFGETYANSAPILAVLSIGFYAQALLGIDARMLKVAGRVRTIVAIDAASAVVAIVLYLVLLPVWGAWGGAIGLAATMTLRSLLNCWALRRTAEVRLERSPVIRKLYGAVAVSSILLIPIAAGWLPAVAVGVPLIAVAAVVITYATREVLEIEVMFPELTRVPGVRRFFGAAG